MVLDLTDYGYAPGHYAGRCKHCGRLPDGGLAKKATSCRECATRRALEDVADLRALVDELGKYLKSAHIALSVVGMAAATGDGGREFLKEIESALKKAGLS